MKKENMLVVVIIIIAVAGVMFYNSWKSGKTPGPDPGAVSVQTGGASAIAWQDYAQGMALAKKQDKHIFLYFHADWCTYCRKLKKTTFQEKAVLRYLNDHFISIAVDTDKDKQLANQWQVRGLPTLWFLKPDNTKISSLPGYVDKEQFLQILKYIHTKSYDQLSFHEFVKTKS